jgi:DNA-binding Lrp family transcriptional regulator
MKLSRYLEFVQADFEPIKSFYIKDELNPKLWENNKLDGEVRESLLKIAEDFYEKLELNAEVKDIALCGSLCNYNWSEKYSDYDLHIIIDFSDVDENYELVEKLVDYAKKVWNEQHNIKIKGYEVEIAVQDSDDLAGGIKSGRMGGVFSLMENKWIKRPEKVEFEPDEKLIREKAKSLMVKIDDIEEEKDEDKYESFIEKIDRVWKKIKDYRKSGLESESGEFSVGNLVFKLLRRNGYIGKVMKMKKDNYDKQFK